MNTAIDLADVGRSGVYLVAEAELDALDATAHAAGHLVRRVSLAGCRDKTDLLQRIARAFEFPVTFGANWDALADCLQDLGWLADAKGYMWLFDHAGDLRTASEHDFDTLRTILDDSCARWKKRSTPCFALLAVPGAACGVGVPAAQGGLRPKPDRGRLQAGSYEKLAVALTSRLIFAGARLRATGVSVAASGRCPSLDHRPDTDQPRRFSTAESTGCARVHRRSP